MSGAALLEVKELEAAYGASQVLFGIDLRVHQGEVATLLGRNGMGKSTAIRAVLGLTPARSGAIALRGQRIERDRIVNGHRTALGAVGHYPCRI